MRFKLFNFIKKKQTENTDNSVVVNQNSDVGFTVGNIFGQENDIAQNQQNIASVDNFHKKKKFNLSKLLKKKPKEQKQNNTQDKVIKDATSEKKFNFKTLFKKRHHKEPTIQINTKEKPQYMVYAFNYQDGEVTTTDNADIIKDFNWLKKIIPKILEKVEEDGIEMPVLFYHKKYAVILQANLFSQSAYFVYVVDKKYIQDFKENKNIEPNEIKKINVGNNKTLMQVTAIGVILIAIAGIGWYMLFGGKSNPKPIVIPKPIKPVVPVAQTQPPPPAPPPDPRVLSISLVDNLIAQLESYKPDGIVKSISINGNNANINIDWLTFKPNARGVFNQNLRHIVFEEGDLVKGSQIDIKPTTRTPQCLEGLAKLHAIFNDYQYGKISFNVNVPINNKQIQNIKPLAIAYLKLFTIVDKACGYNLNLKSFSITSSGITGSFELWL